MSKHIRTVTSRTKGYDIFININQHPRWFEHRSMRGSWRVAGTSASVDGVINKRWWSSVEIQKDGSIEQKKDIHQSHRLLWHWKERRCSKKNDEINREILTDSAITHNLMYATTCADAPLTLKSKSSTSFTNNGKHPHTMRSLGLISNRSIWLNVDWVGYLENKNLREFSNE